MNIRLSQVELMKEINCNNDFINFNMFSKYDSLEVKNLVGGEKARKKERMRIIQ